MTAALKQALEAMKHLLTEVNESSIVGIVHDEVAAFAKVRAAIAIAEAELSQPARVGLTSDRLFKMAADAESPEWGEWFNDEDALLKFARAIERAHNIPAAQEGK